MLIERCESALNAQNAGNAEAAERFKMISAAFAVLSDEGKRQV